MAWRLNTLHNSFNGKMTALWACGELTCGETEELLSNNLTKSPYGHLVAQCRLARGSLTMGWAQPTYSQLWVTMFQIQPRACSTITRSLFLALSLFHSFSVATILLFFSHHYFLVPLNCCGSLSPSLWSCTGASSSQLFLILPHTRRPQVKSKIGRAGNIKH